ncbi:helix-turn-helix transcriptional regulator [Maribacter sp. PR1]|uniref:Helix-turn-helix transcriptional regulator n=1 Tax=Maribacter cobaltidurans TaxID=1178778 RepID=A0ABU7IY86_9FLAO|nr:MULTISPECIES: helix-turn-helix transcriptional regulator [Maribacter]MDC6390561.1 helix-turn-helix transcriptional regulator [Maribacter sp. PR1]MEE1977952.1 helix-turn-helix transcriptional regulator [Maribacter cobaltidurans]
MQFAPSHNLCEFIKHYLIFDIPSNGRKRYRHFSNGYNGLVFTLKKKEFLSLNSKAALPETFIFGQISENQDFSIKGTTSIVIVLFQPFGLYGLTGISATNYFNDFEDSYLIFGKEILELKNRLELSSNPSEVINYLNFYFTKKLKLSDYTLNPILINTIQIVHKKRGNISVNELCKEAGINERKVQRMFFNQIGINPKKFISNIKLHYFLSLLRNQSGFSSLTNLSLQAGYYDQAHLIKEFKKTVGLVPSKYLNTPRLAVNLIEI